MSDQYPAPPPSGPAGMPPQSGVVDTSAWHLQWWFIIVCFLVFWPAGIVLLWVSPVPKKGAKIAVTAVMVLVPLLVGCGLFFALTTFSTSSDWAIEQPVIEQPVIEEPTVEELPPTEVVPEVPFDPSTAVRVAEGVTPEAHVSAYMQALLDGDYATAYALLPTDKKEAYVDESTFAAQVRGYEVQSFTIDSVEQAADTAEITTTIITPSGDFQYVWAFVKDGDTWLVKSRTVSGMTE